MGESNSNCEPSSESLKLLGKKDEPLALGSLHSGGISRQHTASGPSKNTQNMPLQEERIEVGFDFMGFARLQRHPAGIFEVVACGDDKALSNLLTNSTTEVHSIDSKGNTALHHSVESACCKGERDDSFYQCIDLLMGCEQMQVNRPNKKGYTAIGLAVEHLNRTCVEHMLKHPSADRLYLDYYPGDRESTVREIIVEIYPDLEPLLPAPLMERLDFSERNIELLAALQRDEFEVFRNFLNGTNVNLWFDEPYHSYLLEIACQMKNRKQYVIFLLNSGADPNVRNRVTGMPLLQATARCGNFEVLHELLVMKGTDASLKDNEKRTVLHWLAGVSEMNVDDKQKIENCLKLLLKSNYSRKKDIDDRDSSGNTALYIAVERGFRDRAKLLLSKGADVRDFESGSKILLSDSLSIVNEILDDCLQSNDKPLTSKDLQLKLSYQPFMNIVPRIVESKLHRDLLTHPVMSTFLSLKWQKIRLLFFLDMAFYVTFLCSLTDIVLLNETYDVVNDEGAARNTTDLFSFNGSNITTGMNDSNSTFQPNNSFLHIRLEFMAITFMLLVLREGLQLIVL